MGATKIVALPGLQVTSFFGSCLPNLTDCFWPVVLNFVDGRFTVSDLSLDIPAVSSDKTAETVEYSVWGGNPPTPTSQIGLFAAINLLPVTHQDATFERVGVTGRNDDSALNMPGFNTL